MSDIHQIMLDNLVREIQEAEDRRIMEEIDAEMTRLALHPPFWKWLEHEGLMHVTGVRHNSFTPENRWRETKCGLTLNPSLPNFPTEDLPGFVTCVGCLAS